MIIRLRCDPALEAVAAAPGAVARRRCRSGCGRCLLTAGSEMHGGAAIRTVKQCPPFVDAMQRGVHDAAAVRPSHYADGVFDVGLGLRRSQALRGHPRAPINFHSALPRSTGAPFGQDNLIKFVGFWTIELPPGWSLLATHPLNRDDLPFRTLTGLVDADRFHDIGLLFPARWLDDGHAVRAAPRHADCPVHRRSRANR